MDPSPPNRMFLKWDEEALDRYRWDSLKLATHLQRYIGQDDRYIVDYGAGLMRLKGFLEKGMEYYPVDNVRRSKNSIVCDFNKDRIPDLKADVAILSNVLEYVEDVDSFLDKVLSNSKKAIVAYGGKEFLQGAGCSNKELMRKFHDRGLLITGLDLDVPMEYPFIACFEEQSPFALMRNAICTGCGACRCICPEEAISMHEDELGFLKPRLDESICTKCNRCIGGCPTLLPDNSDADRLQCPVLWSLNDVEDTSIGTSVILASEVLGRGGVVFGAVWNSDFSVKIGKISKKVELNGIQDQKHLQSDVGDSYSNAKRQLDEGKPVLYIGCPCQIAGLRRFIGNPSPIGLITVDMNCTHNAPARVFRKYLDERFQIDRIKAISFKYDVESEENTIQVNLVDGTSYLGDEQSDEYLNAFFDEPGIMISDACLNCQFNESPRQGDISLVGPQDAFKEMDAREDATRANLVIVNTRKGHDLMRSLKEKGHHTEEHPSSIPLLGHDEGDHPKSLNSLYRSLASMSFQKALGCVRGKHYDIGITGMFNRNYGNNMTYYALYQTLKDEGLSVLMIDCPKDSPYRTQFQEPMFPMFLQAPYEDHEICNTYPDKDSMGELNDVCDKFILGSDQTVRPSAIRRHGDYGYLGWVRPNRTKVAYATSFSNRYIEVTEQQREEMSYHFKGFDAFSVREGSGVRVTVNDLGFDSVQVMDPVFLCNPKHYVEMSRRGIGRIPKERYIGAYIRFDDGWKKEALEYASRRLGINTVFVIADGHSPKRFSEFNNLMMAKTEEWVASILNCELFFADSFHGICFALIFQKQFVAVFDDKEDDRITDILGMLGLKDRIIDNADDIRTRASIFKPIDYERVNGIIQREVKRSKEWLMDALAGNIEGIS